MTTENTSYDLNELLAAAQLPALPQSAIRLLELSQDPENGPAEFAAPIETDPGLASQVLRFVNSSYFGFSREISSVKTAITLVGVRTIKNFALWSAVFSLLPNPKCGPFDVKSLWRDSLRRGLFARALGRALKMEDAEDLFAAALLQDMAIPILTKELPEVYNEMLETRRDSGTRLSDLEQQQLGWTHADAGATLAKIWKLPERFVEMIWSHSRLAELLNDEEASRGQMAVALAAMLPSACDDQWRERDEFMAAFQQICGSVVCDLAALFSEVDEQFADFAPMLKLNAAVTPLVDCIESEAGLVC